MTQEATLSEARAGFRSTLTGLAALFDGEDRAGGRLAAAVLREIAARPEAVDALAPRPPLALDAAVREAMSRPDAAAPAAAAQVACSLMAWRHPGLKDGRIPEALARRMATAELVGPTGDIVDDRCRVGLFFQLPGLDYVARSHAAEETFVMLAGSGDWRAADGPYETRDAGAIIHHPSHVPHQSRTRGDALLAAWRWTGDIAFESYTLIG